MLLVRKLLPSLASNEFSLEALRATLSPPYFVPSGTPLFQQLQHFQDNRQRIGLVVDEYGEVQGLVTLEDIIEEIVGEVATRTTASVGQLHWSADGTAIVDGSITLRDLNRRLSLELPLDGPKTLNGLLIERLEEIPDAPCCVRFDDVLVEVLHVDEHAVRSARVARIGANQSALGSHLKRSFGLPCLRELSFTNPGLIGSIFLLREKCLPAITWVSFDPPGTAAPHVRRYSRSCRRRGPHRSRACPRPARKAEA